jgi:hypothetical protein
LNASLYVLSGVRFISRTAHPRFGQYRDRSPLWKATTSNLMSFDAPTRYPGKDGKPASAPAPDGEFRSRVSFSHEYIGGKVEELAKEEGRASRKAKFISKQAGGQASADGEDQAADGPVSPTDEGSVKGGKRPAGSSSGGSSSKKAKTAAPAPRKLAAPPPGAKTMLSFFGTMPKAPAAPAAPAKAPSWPALIVIDLDDMSPFPAADAAPVLTPMTQVGGATSKLPTPAAPRPSAQSSSIATGQRKVYLCKQCGQPKKGHVCAK